MRTAQIYDEGYRFAVLDVESRGRLYTPAVFLESSGVRVIKLENRVADNAPEQYLHGRPYPIKRACRSLLKSARVFGISKAARAILKRGLAGDGEADGRV